MAPGRKRGAKGVKSTDELKLGDLVLAKVKGYPAWPAKISRPEDWKLAPDPKKYFVQFFGTLEIAFVAHADVQAFTSELKSKLTVRCQSKPPKFFPQAVTDIFKEFEQLQQQSSSGVKEDNINTPDIASSAHFSEPLVAANNDTSVEGPEVKSEIKSHGGTSSQRVVETENQDLKDQSLDNMDKSSGKTNNNLSLNPSDSVIPLVKAKGKASLGTKPEDGYSAEELNEGGMKKLGKGKKSKQEGTVNKNNSGLVVSQDRKNQDGKQTKFSPDCSIKESSADDKVVLGLAVGDRKEKPRVDVEGKKATGNDKKISQKNSKPLRGHENGTSKASVLSKTSQFVDSVDESTVTRPLKRRKTDAKGHNIKDSKSGNEPRDSSDEDGSPPPKRVNKSRESKSSPPPSFNENKSGNLAPVMQLPIKRRAVRLCDDECDELPKTPIHGGATSKVSVVPQISDLKVKKTVARRENYIHDQQRVLRNSGTVNDALRKLTEHDRASNKSSSLAAQKSMEKKAHKMSTEHVSPSVPKSETDRSAATDSKSSIKKSPPLSIRGTPSSELQVRNYSKAPGSSINVVQKKVIEEANNGVSFSEPSSSFLSQSMGGEEREGTPKAYSVTADASSMPGTSDANVASPGLRLDTGEHEQKNFSAKSKNTESDVSMKKLIAAAQARKRQAHNKNPFPFLALDVELSRGNPSSNAPVESGKISQVDVRQMSSSNQHDNDESEERKMSSEHRDSGSSPPVSGGIDAAVARDAFEGMIETLSRTKESIGRATRQAVDCAKYGISNEVVELLVQKLESEPSLRRKVDLFFLVDSITQCSHSQKGIAGASYIPAVQAALPRIIASAAPPGASAQENRRQCNKVLRLWLERKILPEFILRQHISDLGAVNDDPSSAGISLRRPSRAERAFDDPIREMEGMLVDEYGSNATFQLPGLMASHIFDEEDEEDEHNLPTGNEIGDTTPLLRAPSGGENHAAVVITPEDRRCLVLEDVDGELEMEDVSEEEHQNDAYESDLAAATYASRIPGLASSSSFDFLPSPERSPPLPPDTPPETPPLPSSPSPFAPPPPPVTVSSLPPPPPPPSSEQSLHPQQPVVPPPLFVSQQPMPPFISHHGPPPPPPNSQPFLYPPPPPLPHEASGTANVQNMSSHNLRGEVFSQQVPFLPHAPVFRNISRQPAEYGHVDSYGIQALQQRQPFHHGGASFPQRPLLTEPSPGVLSYPNESMPHQHHPPIFPNDPRRHPSDVQWGFQGYYGTTQERAVAAIAAPNPDHSARMPPSRPGMSTGNWRRA